MRTNYVTLDQKNYLLPFTHDQESIQTVDLSKEALELLHEICNVNTYLRAL